LSGAEVEGSGEAHEAQLIAAALQGLPRAALGLPKLKNKLFGESVDAPRRGAVLDLIDTEHCEGGRSLREHSSGVVGDVAANEPPVPWAKIATGQP